MGKCFCHFNGFEVKDATARRMAESAQAAADSVVILTEEATTAANDAKAAAREAQTTADAAETAAANAAEYAEMAGNGANSAYSEASNAAIAAQAAREEAENAAALIEQVSGVHHSTMPITSNLNIGDLDTAAIDVYRQGNIMILQGIVRFESFSNKFEIYLDGSDEVYKRPNQTVDFAAIIRKDMSDGSSSYEPIIATAQRNSIYFYIDNSIGNNVVGINFYLNVSYMGEIEV